MKDYKFKILNSRTGFSLIETIIYIGIISIVLVSFVSFSINVSDSRDKTFSIQEVQANSRVALDIISQKIRSATGVNISSSVFNLHPGVLSLVMASSTLNPTIISLATSSYGLQIKEGVADPVLITSSRVGVSNLVFTNLTGTSTRKNIGVNFTIFYNSSTSTFFQFNKSIQTAVSLRQ